MTEDTLYCVLTTIREPTDSVRALHEAVAGTGARLIVAGDAKGPASFELGDTLFLDLPAQQASGFNLATILPTGHYARKNIAYLEAIRRGAACIYETDDDNAPLASWAPRQSRVEKVRGVPSPLEPRWVNAYRYFSDALIWPRGFPLDAIRNDTPKAVPGSVDAPIQQGLVNGSPDVDAIWRLTMDRPFDFVDGASVHLAPGNWCPFNTQSTWWWPEAYALLYVPSHCSFRMCDIWKSFIAQRCLWARGQGLVFHAPEVVQERNEHDLMQDFEDEIPGYRENRHIASQLEALTLSESPSACAANLRTCYEALVSHGVFPAAELPLVEAWLGDLEACTTPHHMTTNAHINGPTPTDVPLVSIIVPSYNQGAFIRQSIESCLAQNYRPLEVVVVDGASTDETVSILHQFDDMPEVRWVSEKDSGPVEAVNKGLELARGEIGAIQSSDDAFVAGAVSKAVQMFTDDAERGLVFGNIDRIDVQGNVIDQDRIGPYSLTRLLARACHIPQPAAFFRLPLAREFGGWDERIPYVPDTDLWMRFAFRSKVAQTGHVLGLLRSHDGQRDVNTQRICRDYNTMLDQSADLQAAPLRLRAAAAAGRHLLRLRYNTPQSNAAITRLVWRAVLAYPPCLFHGTIPLHRLVPGYFAIAGAAGRIRRSLTGTQAGTTA